MARFTPLALLAAAASSAAFTTTPATARRRASAPIAAAANDDTDFDAPTPFYPREASGELDHSIVVADDECYLGKYGQYDDCVDFGECVPKCCGSGAMSIEGSLLRAPRIPYPVTTLMVLTFALSLVFAHMR